MAHKALRYIILFFLITLQISLFAQSESGSAVFLSDSTLHLSEGLFSNFDTIAQNPPNKEDTFRPDPIRSVWFGAIIPGYGQILNKKYWKLPIVYSGFILVGYTTNWYAERYQSYKIAYRDIIDTDPNTNSFLDLLPAGYTVEEIFGHKQKYQEHLKMAYEKTRRYRDLWIFGSILYCGLTVLEAYVDATLYDFDISPDLSMRIQPTIIGNDVAFQNYPVNRIDYNTSFGLKCAFHFK